jgi:hypothetical protein
MPTQTGKYLLGLFLFSTSIALNSCTKNLTKRTEIYFNDFEKSNVADFQISNAQGSVSNNRLHTFDNSRVFGPFNSHFVYFEKSNLPEHNVIRVEADLYIHDAWTGNQVRTGVYPDLWIVQIGPSFPMVTTFSNTPGLTQSFPDNFDANIVMHPPGGNSWNKQLPGLCRLKQDPNGSAMYKVEIILAHSDSKLTLSFTDLLQEKNSECDRSWSLDNVRIVAEKYGSGL